MGFSSMKKKDSLLKSLLLIILLSRASLRRLFIMKIWHCFLVMFTNFLRISSKAPNSRKDFLLLNTKLMFDLLQITTQLSSNWVRLSRPRGRRASAHSANMNGGYSSSSLFLWRPVNGLFQSCCIFCKKNFATLSKIWNVTIDLIDKNRYIDILAFKVKKQ